MILRSIIGSLNCGTCIISQSFEFRGAEGALKREGHFGEKNSLRLKGLSGGRDERTRACSKRSDSGVQKKNIESGGKNKKGLAKEDPTFKSIGAHRIF